MEKKETRSFKDYAQRWSDIASQVQPALMEKETTFIIVNTLSEPYYDKMIGNIMRNFSKMVWSSELIEHAIKSKKIEGKATPTLVKKTTPAKKKKGNAHAIFTNQQSRRHISYSSQPSYTISHLPLVQPLSYNSTKTTPQAQGNNFGNN